MNYASGYGRGRGGGATAGASMSQGGAAAAGGRGAGAADGSPAKKMTQPIRPVTIKQLLEAERVGDGMMVIDGKEATQVTVIGRVVDHEAAAASGAMTAKSHGYRISDGTGILLVRQWLDQGAAAPEPLPKGSFLRASGSVKVWQERPIVTGTVRAVTDCNEMTFHFLDALLTHKRLTGAKPRASGAAPAAAAAHPGRGLSAGTGAAHLGEGGSVSDHLIAFIRGNAATNPHGVHREAIVSAMGAQYGHPQGAIVSALRDLCNSGQVYMPSAETFKI